MTQATIPSPNAKEYAQREGGAANGCPWEDVERYRELGATLIGRYSSAFGTFTAMRPSRWTGTAH